MGARQSKRSVDITTATKDGKEAKELNADEQQPLDGKLEKIEEGEKPASNGSSHSEPEIKDDVMANGGSDAPAKELAIEPEVAASPESEVASPTAAGDTNGVVEPEPAPNTKTKKKKKWSFRSISFSKKDKSKPSKEDLAKDAAEVPEAIEEKAEGAGGLLASMTGAVSGAVNNAVAGATEAAAEVVEKVETEVEEVVEKAEAMVASVAEQVKGAATGLLGKVTGAAEAAKTEVEVAKTEIEATKTEFEATKTEVEAKATEIVSEVAALKDEVAAKVEEVVKKVEEIPPPLPASPPPSEALADAITQVVENAAEKVEKVVVDTVDKAAIEVPCINIQPASPLPVAAVEDMLSAATAAVANAGDQVAEKVESVEATIESVANDVIAEVQNGVDDATEQLAALTTQCKDIIVDKVPVIAIPEINQVENGLDATAGENSVEE